MARRRVQAGKTTENQIVTEITAKIHAEKSVKWKTKLFAERVHRYITTTAWDESAILNKTAPGTHPFETGGFIESIHVRQQHGSKGRFISAWEVRTTHPHANFIEYGTGVDKPGGHSPWGPNTPTPEYGIFARAEHHFSRVE